ncbi:nucleotidyltransferase domain-containing protein [Candidatus Woesearchaeota archaeon]|nr:nucleotidyltransferase domain-containing protein [Candidatus Woesearchaeota archaeon]
MAFKTPITGMEIRVVKFLLENISEQFAIREIARKAKIDYKRTHITVQKLVQKNILAKKRQANVDLCSLNLKGDLTALYYVELLRSKDFLDKHGELQSFFQNVAEKVKTPFYSVVIFGSFAKGAETKTSDLDILIIVPSRDAGEEIVRVINAEALLLKRKVQSIVLDEKEFVQSLSEKKLNVVVEAFKNHVIIAGVEGFYHGVRQTL